ncbi:hypothetical protein JXQ70_13575 [bacterium]|nr:hypothetical protein [bacterium]
MGIVNLLKFNDRAGAMISDEEYWVWGRRRSFFTDHIYRITDAPLNEHLGMELFYGGTVYPPFHMELVEHLKKKLQTIVANEQRDKVPTNTELIGYMLLEEAQNTIQRRVNDHLRFLYGLTIDDVNRGFFEIEGKKYDLKQQKVIDEATEIVLQKGSNAMLKPLYKSRGVLMGIDPEFGFSAYHLNYDQSILAFVSGGFEAIGTGKYASGIALGQYLNTKNLSERRTGIDPVEGVYTLFNSAILASESFCEVGGYFAMVILSQPDQKKLPEYKTIQGDRAKLASEIVHAHRIEQIPRKICFALLDRLIFGFESIDQVEEGLYRAAGNARVLELRLSGFKADVDQRYDSEATVSRVKTKPMPGKKVSGKK